MKIALLLSGIPREWRFCMPGQLAMFQGHELDIFCHFWDEGNEAEQADILAVLKPKAYRFEPFRDFSSWDTNPDLKLDRINIPSRMLSQYTSWREAGRLFEPHSSDYQLAMRSRTDLQFVRSLDYIFPQLEPDQVVLPWANKGQLISDLFAFGSPKGIAFYHTMADHIAEYAKVEEFNSERLLAHHLGQTKDFRYIASVFDDFFFVRRPHMAHYTAEQGLAEKAGRSKWLTEEIVDAHRKFHALRSGDEGVSYVDAFAGNQLQLMAEDKALAKKG